MTVLARYTFTIDELLAALSRRMRDIDDRNGITFIEPGRETSRKALPHRRTPKLVRRKVVPALVGSGA